MIIIWKRWGLVVFFVIVAALLLGLFVFAQMLFGPMPSNSERGVATGITGIAFAALLWVGVYFTVGKVIDKPIPARDSETGQTVMVRPRSSFFFIPLTIWPYLMAALSAGLIVLSLAE